MRIIPAIDIIEGKCVRLSKGDYATKKIYNEDPLEVAKQFEDAGLQYLHLVDLDGAKAKHIVNWKVLEKLATKTHLKIDFGGGIKSDEDLKVAFESGAKQITGGSIAVKEPVKFTSWIMAYGAEKIILGADAMDSKIAVSGWQEESDLEIESFIEDYVTKGIEYVISTDISKDGMLEGSSFDLYESILKKLPELKLIASGGVSSIDDLVKLKEQGLEGAIVGKAIYENRISLKELGELTSP
ncbi:1-(5-phosphoribosyl)-5-[(5-phosphoribosylamino)methylideneamino] imidazole-4-carboxamide isomerase [Ekhidna lutea]|uniref:1-(5-phosphoribosyl)-5-[(5-phosphoribosylamino)methylideneamino] imidazole-4-carboxamide isomerase n=1 Tax=Ekhidna lutea TaxID=447679 RepID=A0A239J3Y6_EKHLU|nr:1-(5-phosphoribosyl)-5-[(5-phosphoribosylamino)methylideneamino]imidazole-4-carboxamide isomerase [Ekhidna lutea]SNT00746.1 1-(5-phosphoribosyl)-5-[(5-phosphoribosylamino)methylideneamino] imidazole-4-carboxamide isomerase [Ekhidna lutea]